MILYLVGGVIVFVLLITIIMYRFTESYLLRGFWRADAEFCENAELSMFVLYLGDNNSYLYESRPGYMLAANAEGIILNNPIVLSMSTGLNFTLGMAKCKIYHATIDWQDNEPEDPDTFPTEFEVAYYPANGKLVMYKDDEVLASLWKDCQMSALESDELLPEGLAASKDGEYF